MLTGPTQISYDWLNQFVHSLGLNDTSEPGINQVRMFYENGLFLLKAWDGSEWKPTNRENPFEIQATGNDVRLVVTRNDGASGHLNATDTYVWIGSLSNHGLRLGTNSGVKVTISKEGNVGIGTTNPTSKLDVDGPVKIEGNTAWHSGNHGIGSGLDADLYRGAKVQWGTAPNAKNTGSFVYYPEAFSTIPKIILTARSELTVWKTDITTTYFKIFCNSDTNKSVDWLAIG